MPPEEQSQNNMSSHQREGLEVEMVGEERWAEIRRLHVQEGQSVSAIARLMELNRKTVRRCLRESVWRPYQRRAREDTLLAPHSE